MKITFLTLFPSMYDNFINTSIINKAVNKEVVEFKVVNIRDYSEDKNKRVDDVVVGGGAGVVLKCDPVIKAIKDNNKNSKVIFLSSKGNTYNQKKARKLASSNKDLVLLCGHYEGIDERILDYVDEEISIGDYILTGGELPSMILADSITRLLDGAINVESIEDESYENGLLEYPQYTLPKNYEGKEIPEILFCGNHKIIEKWRKKESLKLTLNRRKDLLENYKLNDEEKELMDEIKNNEVGRWEVEAIKKSKKIKIHTLKLIDKYFYLIKDNKKTYELRMNDEKRKEIKVGDEICFLKEPDHKEYFYKKVKELHYFKSFEELANTLPLDKTGFSSKEELVTTMNNIYKDKLDKYEIVAIELKN